MHRTHADDLAGRSRHAGDDATPLHRPHRRAATQELAGQVDRDNRVPVGQRHLGKGRVALQPGIGDQDVDATKPLDMGAEHRLDLGLVRDIGPDRDGVAAAPADVRGGCLGLLGPADIIDRHVGPGGAETERDGEADPRIGAGHQRLLPNQRPPHSGARISRCHLASSLSRPTGAAPGRTARLQARSSLDKKAGFCGNSFTEGSVGEGDRVSASDFLLAIDQGTTSTRAILFDAGGAIQRIARRELRQIYPQPGWVEHDPEEIWDAVVATCREAIAAAAGRPVAAIGITNQRETTVLWDRASGRPVHNAIVWQDRRTAGLCEAWRAEGLAEPVGVRTGLVLDPYFSASKIRWLLDAVPGLRPRAEAGEIAFGTIDCFLLWRLTGGAVHATDVTNASRTMLFDLHRLDWDAELLDAFRIPRALLPEIRDTDADYGATAPALFDAAIPIAGIAGDQHAALIGQACFRPGMVKSTYGTGAFALLHTGDRPASSRNGLLTTVGYRLGGATAYALERSE